MKALHFNAGFSLIEVMVAILILGIALAALARGITTALASSKDSEMQTTAALFAAGKIEELRALDELKEGESDGDCGPGLELYRWKETISAADTEGLYDVDVVIEDTHDGGQIYELKTMLFKASDSTVENQNQNQNNNQKRRHRER